MKRFLSVVVRCFASLQLAVILLPILALVLAIGTVLETRHGAAYVRWYVYETVWFVGLLALLGLNIFCAAAVRFPWKRHQFGFVVTHCGLLILLAGAVQSFRGGIEGRISLREGETTDEITVSRMSRITASWLGQSQQPTVDYTFDGGPVNWQPDKWLDSDEVDGVRLRILRFLQSANPTEEWVADESKLGGPAVQFRVRGSDGSAVAESWLVDQQFGDALSLGPLRLQLQRTQSDSVLNGFLEPSTEPLRDKGLLEMVYNDVVQRVPVEENLTKKIPLGDTGVAVEISSYLANAQPDKIGNFVSKDEKPKNPMLELKVYVPGETQPLRQIAFAKDPLLNLDGVYSRVCPVKFRWYHPAIQPPDGIEILQVADGRLFGRLCSAGTYQSEGELKPGKRIRMPGNFEFELVHYFQHARNQVSFVATNVVSSKQESEPAALVEISAGDVKRQVWLRRDDPRYGQSRIDTKMGALLVTYGTGRIPLGSLLTLIDFRRDKNPGNVGNAAFASEVRVVDRQKSLEKVQTIAMNEPLRLGRYTLYQSSFEDAGHGRESSTFSVAYDPGRLLKYIGSLMICSGIAIMFYMRAYFFKNASKTSLAAEANHDVLQREPVGSAA